MTLLPSSDFGIRGHAGNAYDVPETCSHPTCGKYSAHVHHCWPRSYLRGQPYEWVFLENIDHGRGLAHSVVIGNRLGFCVEHHDNLTGEIGGYKARLVWETGVMWWDDRVRAGAYVEDPLGPPGGILQPDLWSRIGPTKHQPPVMLPNGDVRVRRDVVESHTHATQADADVCPTCGHHKAKPERSEPKPGRVDGPVKEWVAAGDPEGAALLDEHVENFAIPLGMSDWTLRQKRYHVTSIVFAWAEQHREEFIADVAEAAERRLRAT